MENNISRIKRSSLLQHDSTDCGATCLASVIRYFGGEAGIEMIRKLSGTSQSGTTMLGLYQAAAGCGMEVTGYEASVDDIIAFNGVLILHVTNESNYDHYIIRYGYQNDRFIIWDPSSGLTYKTKDDINNIWKSRKCLALKPGHNFKYRKSENKEKRKWLADMIKPEKELLMISLFTGILISVLGIVMAVFTQKLIDIILPSGEVRILILSSVLVFVLLSSRVVLSVVRQYLLLSQGKSFNIRIVDSFFQTLLFLPKSFFDTRKTGDLVARLNDTMRIQRVISDLVSVYIIDILVMVITLVMVFHYSVTAGIISILSLPVMFFIVFSKNKTIIRSQHDLMAGYALNEGNYINSLKGNAEIKSMNWHKIFSARNKQIFSLFQERVYSLGKIKAGLGLTTGLAGNLYLMALLVYSSLEVIHSQMTKGELMAILSLSSTLLPSVLNLALMAIPFSEAKVAIERMFEFTRISPESSFRDNNERGMEITKVSLKNISFRFPGQRLFLSDISLDIGKGRLVALVGESGTGKSTLLNIIMKFYSPESGRIIINDDTDYEKILPGRWRDSVGLIPQDVHLFNGTILENIIPEPTEEKVNKLLKMTSDYGLDSFINSMPLGFATVTGEDGVKLSGGQKQVVAFMRALIKEPDILLIDEGTSGMDRDTEDHFLKILMRIRDETGILLVTHRINFIRKLCDYVYILEEGKIKTSGTHDDLICTDNIYKRFWEDFN